MPMAETDVLDLVLAKLDKVRKQSGTSYVARCPAHDDHNPSLSVTTGKTQPVILNCHAGCHVEDVMAALALSWADICAPSTNGDRPVVVATYVYTDEFGSPLHYTERMFPKAFRQGRYVRGRQVPGLGDVRRVLYHLPQVVMGVANGSTIWLVEGEKDVHALERAGQVATCNPMGAGKWDDGYTASLEGADVVIVADIDPAGRGGGHAGLDHARRVWGELEVAAASVRIVRPAAGKDTSDHLAAGLKLDEFVPVEAEPGLLDVAEAGEPPAELEPSEPVITPEEFWQARDVLARLHDFAQASQAGPWAVLGAALARMTASMSPAVMLPALTGGRASLNLFVALVGPSGAGKGVAERAAEQFLGRGVDVITSGVGSGEGIAHLYAEVDRKGACVQKRNRCVLMTVPEIDTMAALNSRRGSTLLPELRKAWMGEQLAFQYATKDKRLLVPGHSYRLSLIAGVQPTHAGALLDDVDGGTPQRFIWLPVNDPNAPDEPPPPPRGVSWGMPGLSEIGDHDGELTLGVCDKARAVIRADRLARLRGGEVAYAAHAALCRLKVAAALAWLSRPDVMHLDGVGEDDWDLAGVVMAMSDRTRQAAADAMSREAQERNESRAHSDAARQAIVADDTARRSIDQACARILSMVSAARDGVRRKQLRGAMNRHRDVLDDALAELVRRGEIIAVPTERDANGRGGSGVIYRRAES